MNNMCITKISIFLHYSKCPIQCSMCQKQKKLHAWYKTPLVNKFETMKNIYQKSTKATQLSRSSILEEDAIDSRFKNLERKCKWGHTFGLKTMGARENIVMRNCV